MGKKTKTKPKSTISEDFVVLASVLGGIGSAFDRVRAQIVEPAELKFVATRGAQADDDDDDDERRRSTNSNSKDYDRHEAKTIGRTETFNNLRRSSATVAESRERSRLTQIGSRTRRERKKNDHIREAGCIVTAPFDRRS